MSWSLHKIIHHFAQASMIMPDITQALKPCSLARDACLATVVFTCARSGLPDPLRCAGCATYSAAGTMLFNNIDDGYLEGLLRGFRGGILTSADYANLCQCESIDGLWPWHPLPARTSLLPLPSHVHHATPHASSCAADMKMHLASTDYGNFLQNEPSPISTTTLAEKCTVRLAAPLTGLCSY